MDWNAQAPDIAGAYIFGGTCLLIWVMIMAVKFIDSFVTSKDKLGWEDVVLFSLLGIVTQACLVFDAAGLMELKWITLHEAVALNIAAIPVYVSLTWIFVMWARGDYDKVVVTSVQHVVKRPVVKTTLNIVALLVGLGAMCAIPTLV